MITHPLNQRRSGLATMIGESQMDISAHWDGSELDLTCSPEGLRKLIGVLRRNELGIYRLSMEASGSETENISTLEIESRSSKLSLAIADERAVFSGNLPSLNLLADNLEFLLGQWLNSDDQHLHLEPASNAFLFSPESEAFIVSQRSPE